MYIPIKIDLDDLIEEFELNPRQIENLASDLSNEVSNTFFAALKQRVNSTLKSAKGIYLKNLSIQTLDPLTKEIVLSGWLPNAIEEGVSPFDMKAGFQRAKNVKISSKGNWYVSIPFLHSGPNSSGEVAKPLPKEIHEVVKKQKSPLKENQIPESYRLRQIKQIAGGGTYQHKSSIYTGLKKNEQSGNGYINFRRVGAVSDVNSFMYPGLQSRDFFGKALLDIENEIPILADKIIDDFLKNQGF